jgi:putative ABC transport system permease protein
MRWLRRFFHKSRAEQELDQELRFHLDRRIDDHISVGMTPEEASRRARLQFGGIDRAKEEVRDTQWETWWENLFRDFRYALRNLGKDKRFALVAIFALALGIGASTVAFSTFYNLLFKSFAARDANRLVVFSWQNAETADRPELSLFPLAGPLSDLNSIRSQNKVFEDVIGYHRGIVLLRDENENHQLYVARVTSNAFDFYGVPPLFGRGIAPADGAAGAPPVFVMSYKTWKAEFNADPKAMGKSFIVDDEPRMLVGIMPPRFQAFGALQQIWIPISDTEGASGVRRPSSVDTMMARLKPGVGVAQASAALDLIVKRLAKNRPDDFPEHFSVRALSATDFLMGPWGIGSVGGPEFGIKQMLCNLLAGATILLLIACSGVANLLLARATVRGKEIAMRAALGAARGRLLQQLLVESSVLAIAACALGCLFAFFGMRGVAALVPHKGESIGGEAVIGLDWPILLFALGITVLTTVLCGLAPAFHAVRRDLQSSVSDGNKGTSGSFRHGRIRAALVVSEVALSVVLLSGAGLMIRSFYQLTHIDLGFNLDNLLFVAFEDSNSSNKSSEQDEIVLQKTVQRLKETPGVAEVAINNSLPGYNPGQRHEVAVPSSTHSEQVGLDGCSESLFRALELQMFRGRWFSEGDVASARRVAVINQTMALHFFGGEDPVGHQILAKAFVPRGQSAQDVYFQVIGVLRDVKDYGPQVPVIPMAFIPYTIQGGGFLLLKTKVPPASLMHEVQQIVWAFDRDEIFAPEFGPYQDTFYRLTYSAHEFGLMTFAPLAGIALLLAVIGVFSVMAYTVSLQTHEIGVRMALGAQKTSVLMLVLFNGFRLVATGILIGLLFSYALTRFLISQISGVSATDPWTFSAVVTLVVLVGLAACLLPARRASQIDPLVALRYE